MRDLDLSYDCLTGTAVRSKLRNLRNTDPIFWDELTLKDPEKSLPPEDVPQAEDKHNDTLDDVDDSDVPIDVVIKNIVADVAPQGYALGIEGGFQADSRTSHLHLKSMGLITRVESWDVGNAANDPTNFTPHFGGTMTQTRLMQKILS